MVEPQSNSSLSCFLFLPWQGIWVLSSWHPGWPQFFQEASFRNEEMWRLHTVPGGSRLVAATFYWHPGAWVGCPLIRHHRASYSGEIFEFLESRLTTPTVRETAQPHQKNFKTLPSSEAKGTSKHSGYLLCPGLFHGLFNCPVFTEMEGV